MTFKVQLSVTWTERMLEDVLFQAHRLDRSLSSCVQSAWLAARDDLARIELGSVNLVAEARFKLRFDDQTKVKQTLFFPTEMADDIKLEADRLDRSASWLLQRAWCLGAPSLEALPAAASFDDAPLFDE